MGRIFFRTSLVHSCFSQEMAEPLPKKCRCRKRVSREDAQKLVNWGVADWLVDWKTATPTWNLVLRGRTTKTPRAHTLESANPNRAPHSFGQIERGCDLRSLLLSDNGSSAEAIEAAAEGNIEAAILWDTYKEIEMETRYRLFRGCAAELQELKIYSDSLKILVGPAGKLITNMLVRKADTIKNRAFAPDPFPGRR